MSLLSSFIKSNLITNIEHSFKEHAPELQDLFIQEVQELSDQLVEWIKRKIQDKENKDIK